MVCASGNGIYPSRKCEKFRYWFPPLDEQTAIVRFLDHAQRRMDKAIRAKRKLIALLNEQKQAIIHRAVTRGLDPAAPLKDSGIPWLGKIPKHWEALQVRRVVSLVTSGSRGWAAYYSEAGDIFLQSGNLGRSMSLNLSFIQYVKPPSGSEGIRTKVRRDDVLICITGAITGNVAIVDVDLHAPAYVNQHVALIRPKSEMMYPRFLAFALYSNVGKIQFKTNEYGGTKQGLGLGEVKAVFVPVPPLNEQESICLALDGKLARFNNAISQAEREITLLREYQTRLTADVVTGKLDVREAARRLPEDDGEPAEPEAADGEETLEESSLVEYAAERCRVG
jgi:type I restriction enzyme S subunit